MGADRRPAAERNNLKINPAAMPFSDGVFFDPRDRPVQDVVHGRLRHPYLPGDLDRRHRLDAAVVRCREGHEHHERFRTGSRATRAIRARCGSILAIRIRGAATRCRSGTTTRSCCLCRRTASTGTSSARPATPSIDRRSSITRSARCGYSACAAPQYPGGSHQQPVAAVLGIVRVRRHRDVGWIRAGGVGARRQPRPCARGRDLAVGALQPRLRRLRKPDARPVLDLARRVRHAREKINDITVGFSRDGFHWARDDRTPFVTVSETPGSWNWANVQSAGGGCLIVGDKLHFYVSGRQGEPGTERAGRVLHGPRHVTPRRLCVDGLAQRRSPAAPRAAERTARRISDDAPNHVWRRPPFRER